MNDGADARAIGFFDSISDARERWNYNSHFHRRILRLAGKRNRALDLGCGSGELTRELACKRSKVIGIDVSSAMIAAARSRNWGLDIEYLVADAHRYLEGRREEFDLIVSVAALHSMDEERILALAPGGMLVVLDLYRPSAIMGKDDCRKTLADLRLIARRALGECRLERAVFWRYILSYEKAS